MKNLVIIFDFEEFFGFSFLIGNWLCMWDKCRMCMELVDVDFVVLLLVKKISKKREVLKLIIKVWSWLKLGIFEFCIVILGINLLIKFFKLFLFW